MAETESGSGVLPRLRHASCNYLIHTHTHTDSPHHTYTEFFQFLCHSHADFFYLLDPSVLSWTCIEHNPLTLAFNQLFLFSCDVRFAATHLDD